MPHQNVLMNSGRDNIYEGEIGSVFIGSKTEGLTWSADLIVGPLRVHFSQHRGNRY